VAGIPSPDHHTDSPTGQMTVRFRLEFPASQPSSREVCP
jgi:hypothetical protein